MKERPILFSGPMVRAILDGSKTQTRRVIKNTGTYAIEDHHGIITAKRERAALATQCRYGQPGDQLWVRETWQGPILESEEHFDEWRESPDVFKKPGFCVYRATDTLDAVDEDGRELGWRPSIHMPRWASRILLEVTGVRVERLQDISQDDAKAEGVEQMGACPGLGLYRNYLDPMTGYIRPDDAFSSLWNSINGAGTWNANPWVWVIEFKRVTP